MRERPILFAAPMVRALLEGRKTQTRRLVKPQPDWDPEVTRTETLEGKVFWPIGSLGQQCGFPVTLCPYGVPGDRLYVREAWRVEERCNDIAPRDLVHDWPVAYEAGVWSDLRKEVVKIPGQAHTGRLRPGIHMPRWASRLTLQQETIRIERLKDCTEADALAEGIKEYPDGFHWEPNRGWPGEPPNLPSARFVGRTARQAYFGLWQEINGRESLDANPWVWVNTFKLVET